MFSHLALPFLMLLFAGAAAAVWVAGIQLSKTTDVLASHFGLGEALGGLILLAIVTNLPECAITISAALHHNVGIAIGNILGGIAIQTVVLVILDAFLGRGAPLTYRAASLILVLEGLMVMAILTLVVMGHQFPATAIFARLAPADVLIAAAWVTGLMLIDKARKGLPWQLSGSADKDAGQGAKQSKKSSSSRSGIGRTMRAFAWSSVVTLIAGVVLEQSGAAIATHIGMSGVLFGATVLAAATSLPELSTGLASLKMGDYKLAISDIFGGNAFLPVLFLVATVLSGQSVLPQAQKTDIYLTGLGMLLTVIYIYGLILRPQRKIARMGIDSFAVLIVYVLGMGGLLLVAHS